MKKEALNSVYLELESKSANESFARGAVSSFVSQLDPTLEELTDIRTVVSEAVTNSIIHGYRDTHGLIYISVKYFSDRTVRIVIKDKGHGIADLEQAMQPLYTSDPNGERGGMGFTIMDSFTDKLTVKTAPGKGTTVTMIKKLS